MKKLGTNYQLGFTLIELLIVISIIGVLSSIVVSSTGTTRAKARDSYRISQIHEVKTALDLYYSSHGSYPINAFPLTFSEEIPHNWAFMIGILNSQNLIQATFSKSDIEDVPRFSLAKVAHAIAALYYNCSLQDPLYKTATDFQHSYGYVVAADNQSYKIRIYLETENSRLFQDSLEGTFLGSATTGNTACDKNLHYYCTGR